METASFDRSSALFMLSSLRICASSGASMTNSTPMSGNVFDSLTPQSKSTMRPCEFSDDATAVFTFSVAVMLSVGFIGFPVHCI